MKRNHLTLRILAGAWLLLLFEGAWQLAWEAVGSGAILNRFSTSWFLILAGYGLFGGLTGLGSLWALWRPSAFNEQVVNRVEAALGRLGAIRWPLIGLLWVVPSALFLGPMLWLFGVPGFRAVILFSAAVLAGLSLPQQRWSRSARLGVSVVAAATIYTFAREFIQVTDYPFKLLWSEGNRLWDYSLYLGTENFTTAGEFEFPSYLTPGRHGLWGLAYLIPDTPIWAVRLWDALLWTVPYLLLGWVVIRRARHVLPAWHRAGFVLWTFLFLAQGHIMAPLVLATTLVLLMYDPDRPWRTAAGAAAACLYAGLSRWTWMFAPAMFAGVLYLLDQPRTQGLFDRFKGSLLIGAVGLLAGFGSQQLMDVIHPQPGAVYETAFSQTLLWYRLLPSASNTYGLLPGLFVTVGPVLGLLLVGMRRGWIRWDKWQRAGVAAAMLAFFAVGTVASVKIGGGNNLHNFDMFFLALVALAGWGFREVARRSGWQEFASSGSVRTLIALSLVIPAWWLLKSGAPLDIADRSEAEAALDVVQQEVEEAQQRGPVLFVDQRQLFTFGHMGDTPLVMEYEMKHMMNQALSNNEAYFDQFERDLAAGRFSLIVLEPQKIMYQGREAAFGEENDAWVRHVSTPILEHYEPVYDLIEVEVWLMAPKQGANESSP